MPEIDNSNRKTVVKNTLYLYVRMFFTMIVGLYTSRVVLNTLGASDYGVYNVVGGVITMMTFLNTTMMSATQRFMAFELGRKDFDKLSNVFSTAISVYLVISIIIVFLGETVGLWFVNNKLVIPEGRMLAANWVFQASLLIFIVNMLSVPFNAAIIAHERMSVYAYVSIVDVLLKLLIVYLLIVIPFDKLQVYAVLMVIISFVPLLIYSIYCFKMFSECRFRIHYDMVMLKEMFSFAGWSILGNFAFSGKSQGSNIILNMFYGTTLNAARSIGITVSTMVSSFATNFMMALSPQITKQYASGNIDESRKYVYYGSKYSYYLLLLISIPLVVNIDYILELWLVNVPSYTKQFVFFSLIESLLYSMSGCVTVAIQATGKVKWFQIGVCIILLSELPFAWILMNLGYPPFAVMWPTMFTSFLALLFRFYLLRKYVVGYTFKDYLFQVVLKCLIVSSLGFVSCWYLFRTVKQSIWFLLYSSLISILVTAIIILLFGMRNWERRYIIKYVLSFIQKRR